MKKILSRTYSLRLNNIIWFLTWGLLFWFFIYLFIYLFISNGHIYKVAQKLPNIKKIYAENDNTVSTLSNVVQINLEIGNVDSTLFNVVNFNIDVHNVVSTLIWSWATSRRHISLNVTLKRRWNVCWEVTLINFSKKKKKKKCPRPICTKIFQACILRSTLMNSLNIVVLWWGTWSRQN